MLLNLTLAQTWTRKRLMLSLLSREELTLPAHRTTQETPLPFLENQALTPAAPTMQMKPPI